MPRLPRGQHDCLEKYSAGDVRNAARPALRDPGRALAALALARKIFPECRRRSGLSGDRPAALLGRAFSLCVDAALPFSHICRTQHRSRLLMRFRQRNHALANYRPRRGRSCSRDVLRLANHRSLPCRLRCSMASRLGAKRWRVCASVPAISQFWHPFTDRPLVGLLVRQLRDLDATGAGCDRGLQLAALENKD